MTRAFGTPRRRLWKRRDACLNVKMKVFDAIVLLVLLYSATAWATTPTESRSLNGFEMRMLRIIA